MSDLAKPMTIEEVVETYGVSKTSITSNFPRVQKSIEKNFGVTLEKVGRGTGARYVVKNVAYTDSNRALTLYDSVEKNLIPAETAAGLLDLHFLIFIAIVSTPLRVFRGSYADLLNYIEIEPTMENIYNAREILRTFAARDYIMYMEDKTDGFYFVAAIMRQTEKDMEFEINAVLHFKRIIGSTRKSWIPLMKTYLALNYLE